MSRRSGGGERPAWGERERGDVGGGGDSGRSASGAVSWYGAKSIARDGLMIAGKIVSVEFTRGVHDVMILNQLGGDEAEAPPSVVNDNLPNRGSARDRPTAH